METREMAPSQAEDSDTAETWELRGHRPDPYFAGRRDELEALYRAFRTQGNTSAVQVISGLGKTRLAIECAWRYAAATTWCGGYARKIPPRGEATMPRIAGRDPC
jgi:hypothetical protein